MFFAREVEFLLLNHSMDYQHFQKIFIMIQGGANIQILPCTVSVGLIDLGRLDYTKKGMVRQCLDMIGK